MPSLEEAQDILATLGMPSAQSNTMSGFTLIALCGLTPDKPWSEAQRNYWTITKGIMYFLRDHYEIMYAPNTRETFRRQVLHQFVQGRIADRNPCNPALPTNSPSTHYAITEAALGPIRLYATKGWEQAVDKFKSEQSTLAKRYERERSFHMVPIKLPNGQELQLSPGEHNKVQKAIIEEFAPRFSPQAHLLYLGDTAKKNLFIDEDGLVRLGIQISVMAKLPDVVLYDAERNWLFLVEAVTSHGPISPKRIVELKELLVLCQAGPVYVSAFPDVAEFRKHMRVIAWETEV